MTDLNQSYLSTLYKVDGLQVPIQIGKKNPELDLLLSKYKQNHWCFITAWNQFSKPLTLETNRKQNEDLLSEIKANSSYIVLNGVGESPDGSWSEESILVLGIDNDTAQYLARKYEQNAIVVGVRVGLPELVMLQ
ncbi:DUF3293 domain-containing protein [Leptospira paudalimensis]|uniref:DUF3293 domain-containing protein n=1 Tax=Leptospira paudalimensis TaxID=2950024 RepID=A0ABT3MCL1_9LEPT|nr:DUF3293 domain-containing protein [Leptospira paudalimensis]MCW7506128.1 DUF3293 domain-containing protein [Leptospira paudalimensis]